MDNKARVIAEYKGAYKVKNNKGEFLAKVTGKQMFVASSREDYPAIGDWVIINELGEGQAVIKEILPRKTIIKRKYSNKNDSQIIATNIDVGFVVESIGRDYNLNRFERYFAIMHDGGIKPAIILNKIDLISKEELLVKLSQIENRFPGIDIIATSIMEEKGFSKLKSYIEKDKTYCFLGSSGVGKSSLINKLLGKNIVKTEDISLYSNRGKHITTTRQMYFLPATPAGGDNGGIVIDNPGMREIGMADAGDGVDMFFDKITALSEGCRYGDCTHIHENGCAVLEAVELGKIDRQQYQNYINLKKESEYYKMSELEKKEKDKDFGKFIKKAKKSLKEYGHKN
ncbi:MAG: ribosome small subunit-dependent GTPase A [Candidatus Staskawiczbacteria bacterium]|jgi:ribosome biogenesis GTPase